MGSLKSQMVSWGDRTALQHFEADKMIIGSEMNEEKGDSAKLNDYFVIKNQLHQKMLDKIDLKQAEALPPDQLKQQLRLIALSLIAEAALPLNETEQENLARDLQNEILGLRAVAGGYHYHRNHGQRSPQGVRGKAG